MIFTDDDLKRLKEMLDPHGMSALYALKVDKWRAFLARLEAAEECVNLLDRTGGKYSGEIEAWRKVAGK